MTHTIRTIWHVAALMVLIAVSTLTAPLAQATSGERPKLCFGQTGQCMGDPFLSYWEQNGGLPVFGYPVTAAREELNRDTGKRYLTQWFERARLEYHPENRAPYHILLGRLGADQLDGLGATAVREQAAKPGCLWFPQTGHNVCNQATGIGFMNYWQTHGLLDLQLNGYQRSLALFGYPLTEPRVVTNASGDKVLTQWFERARFEYHPTKPQPFKVLLGLMGVERYPEGKLMAPASCNALATTPSNVAVGAGFCIQWRDSFADEQQFLITLKYLNSGEEFRYSALPNTTQIYVPASDAPSTATFEQCMRRKDFTLRVEAIRPNATTVVGEMAGESECRR